MRLVLVMSCCDGSTLILNAFTILDLFNIFRRHVFYVKSFFLEQRALKSWAMCICVKSISQIIKIFSWVLSPMYMEPTLI